VISNQDLWSKGGQEEITAQSKRRKWKWIGHMLKMGKGVVERDAQNWNSQGSRSRGRLR
jgi:hypothetical protein